MFESNIFFRFINIGQNSLLIKCTEALMDGIENTSRMDFLLRSSTSAQRCCSKAPSAAETRRRLQGSMTRATAECC